MPYTLEPYKYQVPETGDTGRQFLEVIQDLVERVSGHDHDGANSRQLAVTNIANTEDVRGSGELNWSSTRDDDGLFTATIPLPGALVTGERTITFFEHLRTAGVKRRAYLDFTVNEGTGSDQRSIVLYSNKAYADLTIKYA